MSAKFVSNKDETTRLFENPILEALSHVHPITPFVVYVPITLILISMSWNMTILALVMSVISGLVFWTLFEYLLHRFVFHYTPKTQWGKRFHYFTHGIHHDYPKDSTRLVMPLGVSIPLAGILYLPFYLFAGLWGHAFFAGFLFGYMCYDAMHFAVHHLQFNGKIGRFMQAYHMKHHFHDDHNSFGVSSPLWDIIFSTKPKQHTQH
jgi:sterol desaturase/sphingolipid hydroxylase (fatty acid hydroxylase superfamily)